MANNKGTIKIPRGEFEKHNARRKADGLTWEEYIDGQAPEMFSDLAKQLNRIEDSMAYDDVRAAAKAGAKEAIEESVQR